MSDEVCKITSHFSCIPHHSSSLSFSFSLSLHLSGPEKGRCVASEYFTEPEIEITTENTANILSKSHPHIQVGKILLLCFGFEIEEQSLKSVCPHNIVRELSVFQLLAANISVMFLKKKVLHTYSVP